MRVGSFAAIAVLKVTINEAAVLVQKLHGNASLRSRRGYSETRFHVLNDSKSGAADRLNLFRARFIGCRWCSFRRCDRSLSRGCFCAVSARFVAIGWRRL